jgi:hypothetical protein
MPRTILKTSTDVVILCQNHEDFVIALLVCDEFQHFVTSCAGDVSPPTAVDKAALRNYLQSLPDDIP